MKKYILLPVLMLLVFTACNHKNNDNSASTTAETQLTEDNKENDPFVGEYYEIVGIPGLNQIARNGELALRIEKIDDQTYKVNNLISKDEQIYKLKNGEFIYRPVPSMIYHLSFSKEKEDILTIYLEGVDVVYYTNVKNRDKFKIYKP
ncbi:hypothetical protein [Ornithobacterium rhinotracheale]